MKQINHYKYTMNETFKKILFKTLHCLLSLIVSILATTFLIATTIYIRNTAYSCIGSSNPCLNNGVCVPKFLDIEPVCNCPSSYFGDLCELCICFTNNNTCTSEFGDGICNFKHQTNKSSTNLYFII